MTNVHKISVSIELVNNVSRVLSTITRDVLGLRSPIAMVGRDFEGWGKALKGAAGILTGGALIGGLVDVAKHGEVLLDQQDKLRRAGLSNIEVVKLTADAYKRVTAAVPTATAADVLRSVNELRTVTGSVTDAQGAVERSLMLEALVSNSTGKSAEGAGYNVWRSLEMKGVAMDEKTRDTIMGQITASIIASGGRVTGQDWRNFAQQAGPSWQMANQHAMTGTVPYLIQEMGGERAGTGWNRAANTIMGTRRWTRQEYEAWKGLGLIDQSKVLGGDEGGLLNFASGGPIKGGMDNIGDLEDFITKTVMPAFQAHGITEPNDVNARLAKMFPDSTAARVATRIYQQHANIDKDRTLNAQALPLSQAYRNFTTNNPKGVGEAFNKQYESMLQAIGAPMMQAALPVMKQVTEMFQSFGSFANANPTAVKVIAEAVAALGIALVGAGAAAIIAIGGIPAVITGLVAALATLIALNWGSITSGLNSIKGALAGFIDWVEHAAGSVAEYFKTRPTQVFPGGTQKLNQSFDGDPHDLKKPIMFNPASSSNSGGVMTMQLNIDGRTLASAVVDHLEQILGTPTSAAAADGTHSPWSDQYTGA